jgi:transcriptional regulator with XRE-family HTH domain
VSEQPDEAIPEWTLGWRLNRALKHAGISAADMAADLGISRATVSRWINDHGAPPRVGYVKLWALRTGVSTEWLLEGVPVLTGRGVTLTSRSTAVFPPPAACGDAGLAA